MATEIEHAKETAIKNSKKSDVRSDIQKIVEAAEKNCNDSIASQFAEGRKKANELEKEIKDFFLQIKETVDLDDGFKIEFTTDFKSLDTSSIMAVRDRYKRNPELDEGFFLFRWFKNLFIDDTVNDGIDIDNLSNVLQNIYIEFDANIDTIFDNAKKSLSDASDKLKENMDKLEKSIIDYSNRLQKMKNTISKIAADVDEKTKYEEQLSGYNILLAEVQKYTSFDSIIEME